MKRAFRTHCVRFSNGLKGSTCLYWTDCSFAEKREIVPSRDELFDVWFQKRLMSHFNMEKIFLLTRRLLFCQWFALAKCFDLSRRSEMSSHLFFIKTVFHLFFFFFFFLNQTGHHDLFNANETLKLLACGISSQSDQQDSHVLFRSTVILILAH